MSDPNVQITREAVEALNRGDIEAAYDRAHPEIEWRTLDVFPDAGTYRGPDEVLRFFQRWRESFPDFRLHLGECEPVGDDHVLAGLRVGGEGAGSGARVQSPVFFQLLEFRDGRIVWARMFQTRDEAVEAVESRE